MINKRLTLSTLIAITLFLGGIIILFSHITFWSYFLGLPAVQIGIILLILTFEEISKRSLRSEAEGVMHEEEMEKQEDEEAIETGTKKLKNKKEER